MKGWCTETVFISFPAQLHHSLPLRSKELGGQVCCKAPLHPRARNQTGNLIFNHIRSDQLLSRVRLFVTAWIAARQASLSIINSQSSLRLTSMELVMPSSHLILCRPLLLLPPIPPSIGVFSNESTLRMRWPKCWSFSFSIIPSKEIPGLISFRMYWLDLLAVQGTLKSLLQHHGSKASILWLSAFFTVQLSHPYMTTRKNIALTRRTFVGELMSLLLNMLSYKLIFKKIVTNIYWGFSLGKSFYSLRNSCNPFSQKNSNSEKKDK